MFKVAQRYFGDFPHKNSNIFENYFMIILAGNRFFRIFGKTGPRIRNFFSLKPPRDQDGANKKRFSQIGPAVPELLRDKHTYIQTKTFITL